MGRPYVRGAAGVAGGYRSLQRWAALPFRREPYVHLLASSCSTSPLLPDLLGFLAAADQRVQLPPPTRSRLYDAFRLTERRHRSVSFPPRLVLVLAAFLLRQHPITSFLSPDSDPLACVGMVRCVLSSHIGWLRRAHHGAAFASSSR